MNPSWERVMTIYFYKVNDKHGCFSNFSPHGFTLKGKWWDTAEHYFQAMKFEGTPHEDEIRQQVGPMNAAHAGRSHSRPLRSDWEQVKDDVMREAVLAKFRVNADARKELLSTGDEELVEKTTRDTYWGCGTHGKGKNMLGKILMEVREQLRREGA